MKIWNALSDDAQDTVLFVVFLLEAWFLFGVAA